MLAVFIAAAPGLTQMDSDECQNMSWPGIAEAGPLTQSLLTISLTILITYWAIKSFSEPGGMLHGRDISSRPYRYALRDWLRFEHRETRSWPEENIPLCDPNNDPLPGIRTTFGVLATSVYGWPSTGGVWVHESCYGVELDFLGLSRFQTSPTARFSKEEDEFCKLLEKIGAHFYETEADYNRQTFRYQDHDLWYGWPGKVPGGGVWALRTEHDEGARMGVSRVHNALSMEERCKVIALL
ncbi:hypothetical protein Slin15195_G025060 [Septoria linicola]|uniref:Uncharacterized protein n=1 Tax=Septoria linicola TaxID=215465 RepID=A0A9Q9EGU0_9PEZI|nr:hypothetical protein Slin14017_G024150 [Septoria linicola]USW49187.1 hypothetical protein Slin15195_G025060 [Septoria linicola]